jgi:type IV pilus assembly protein PilF
MEVPMPADRRAARVPPALWALCTAAFVLAGCQTTTLVNGRPVPVNEANPRTSEADALKRADIRLQLAASYYQQRQFAVAIDEAKQALSLNPNSTAAYGLLGLIYMDLDDRAQAEANFSRALRLDPDNPELNNNYGWFLCRTGREKSALEYFQRAASNRLYATPALPLQNAGVCMMQLKDYKEAEAYLRRSFETDANSAVVKFQLARLYLATRQFDRANFYFSLLERNVDPTPETLWLGLRIARAQGDVQAERGYADQLRRRFPNSNEASLLRRGVFDE